MSTKATAGNIRRKSCGTMKIAADVYTPSDTVSLSASCCARKVARVALKANTHAHALAGRYLPASAALVPCVKKANEDNQ